MKYSPKSELQLTDATELADLIRTRQVSAKELVEETINRIEVLDEKINAVVTRSFDRALSAANDIDLDAPFAGVPLLIKDNMNVEGVKTMHGSFWNKDDLAANSDTLIKVYEYLGFIIIGKSSMPEHALFPSTEPKLSGPCHNPWDLKYSPGGSSGGAAASVAAGYMPVAHGNDGGGSLRIPASACGLFGLKPTRYRLIGDLDNQPRSRFKSEHIISRSVRDSASVFYLTQITARGAPYPPIDKVTEPIKKRLKIGLAINGMSGLEPDKDVRTCIEETARRLEDAGHVILPIENPIDFDDFFCQYMILFGRRIIELIELIQKETGIPVEETGMLEKWTIGFGREVEQRKPDETEEAERALMEFERETVEWIKPFDVMLTPVMPTPPPLIGYLDTDIDYQTLRKRVFELSAYTPMQNALGMPAMSIPSGFSSGGLPIGSHFIARAGEEAMLFGLAFELEQLQPWVDAWAPNSIKAEGI